MPDDSTPPLSTEQAAAIAAMRAEWATIKDEVLRPPAVGEDEEDNEAVVAEWNRRTEVMRGFLGRHGATLVAMGMDPSQADGSQMSELQAQYLEADAEAQKAEEKLLQADADVGDAVAKVAVAGLTALEHFEALSQEQWDAMTSEERLQGYDALETFRGVREEFLSRLPLEERKEWERRLGD